MLDFPRDDSVAGDEVAGNSLVPIPTLLVEQVVVSIFNQLFIAISLRNEQDQLADHDSAFGGQLQVYIASASTFPVAFEVRDGESDIWEVPD